MRRRDGGIFSALLSAQHVVLDQTPALVVVIRDITHLVETQELLRISEEKFANAFHASPDGLLISRLEDGTLIDVNEGFTRLTGYRRDEVTSSSTLELGLWVDPEDRKRLMSLVRHHTLAQGFTAPIRVRNGSIRQCEMSAHQISIGGDDCVLTIARDVTERQLMQEKLQQAATVFESTAEGVMITDTRQRITAVNRAFSEITGYSEQEALGRSPSLLSSGQHDRSFYLAMWNQLERDGHWQGEIWNRRKTGELYPEWLTISAVHNPQGEITHFVGVFADISPSSTPRPGSTTRRTTTRSPACPTGCCSRAGSTTPSTRPAKRAGPAPCCSSTWTASSTSTTASAIPSATCCSRRSPNACATSCATSIPWPAWGRRIHHPAPQPAPGKRRRARRTQAAECLHRAVPGRRA